MYTLTISSLFFFQKLYLFVWIFLRLNNVLFFVLIVVVFLFARFSLLLSVVVVLPSAFYFLNLLLFLRKCLYLDY